MGLKIERAARLFATPSFVEGFCRVIDLGSTLNMYSYNINSEEADLEALQSDWFSVGDGLISAMQFVGKEAKEK